MHVIIVGAGAAGTMAAWRLAKSGCKVTLLEQFCVDHDRGSSYGESRIVRRVYPDALYTALMAEAYDLWDELQEEWRTQCPSGQDSIEAELICRKGGLFCGPTGSPDVEAAEFSLRSSKVPFDRLTSSEVASRFPAFQVPADTTALFEPSMGYARASHAVRAAAFLAKQHGAEIVENTAVAGVEEAVGGVAVVTRAGAHLKADRALITAGAWTGEFLAPWGVQAPIKVTRQVYFHFETGSDSRIFSPNVFPTWIDAGANMYGFPTLDIHNGVPNIKVASHDRGVVCTGSSVDRTITPEDRQKVLGYTHSHFPELTDNVVYEKVCLYTNAPDEDFIIDCVPGLPGACVISACSGHGFKFAPLIGQIGAELVRGTASNRDLDRFRLGRF